MTEVQEPPEVPANGKSGTLFTAVSHIFCAVVGAGVLGLPNSLAWLGWIAGPLCLLVFFAVALFSAHLLAQLYLVDGVEFSRYHHAVAHVLGRRNAIAVAIFQLLYLVLACIAYSITGAIAMRTVARYLGSKPSATWQLVLLMGGIEVALSQVPSLEEIWWVSALGTLSSLGYVFIALGLGLAYAGARQGSLGGRAGTSDADKAFGVMNSLGNIAFAFGFAQVLLEIQDTLRQPPKAEKTMRKAVSIATGSAFVLYLSSAVACYAALGNGVPDEVLEGFEDAPDWLLIVANIFICIHMITAWQVWAQPVFETIESHLKARRIRRQRAAAGLPAAGGTVAAAEASAGSGAAKEQQAPRPSPFDVAALQAADAGDAAAQPHPHPHTLHWEPALAVIAEGGQPGQAVAASSIDLEARGSLAHGHMGSLRSGQLSARGSGTSLVLNTEPLPDLLPPGGWSGSYRHGAAHTEGSGVLGSVGGRLGSGAMYHLDTGAANERVPANDAGYLLPLWQRLLVRTSYVLACTLVASIMPFFSAVVGLVGSVCFWPIAIYFPFAMYCKVHKPSAGKMMAMKAVGATMLLVSLAAAVGSVEGVIHSLMHAEFFGS